MKKKKPKHTPTLVIYSGNIDEFSQIKDAAKELGVTCSCIHNYIYRGHIKYGKVLNKSFVKKSDIEFLKKSKGK